MRTKRRRILAEINVVPYIDVMLVLLVIFMITAPLLTQGVDINMPEADAKPLSTKEQLPLIISVDKGGHYYLNVSKTPGVPLLANDLIESVISQRDKARRQGSPRQVMVKGDQAVDYGSVVRLMVLLQQAGVDDIGLMTKSPEDA